MFQRFENAKIFSIIASTNEREKFLEFCLNYITRPILLRPTVIVFALSNFHLHSCEMKMDIQGDISTIISWIESEIISARYFNPGKISQTRNLCRREKKRKNSSTTNADPLSPRPSFHVTEKPPQRCTYPSWVVAGKSWVALDRMASRLLASPYNLTILDRNETRLVCHSVVSIEDRHHNSMSIDKENQKQFIAKATRDW